MDRAHAWLSVSIRRRNTRSYVQGCLSRWAEGPPPRQPVLFERFSQMMESSSWRDLRRHSLQFASRYKRRLSISGGSLKASSSREVPSYQGATVRLSGTHPPSAPKATQSPCSSSSLCRLSSIRQQIARLSPSRIPLEAAIRAPSAIPSAACRSLDPPACPRGAVAGCCKAPGPSEFPGPSALLRIPGQRGG